MEHGCDVCHNFRPQANLRERPLTRVSIGHHVIVLCELHKCVALSCGVTTFAELRDIYGESNGRRSYVPRRTGERASLPDEQRQTGRRSTDAP